MPTPVYLNPLKQLGEWIVGAGCIVLLFVSVICVAALSLILFVMAIPFLLTPWTSRWMWESKITTTIREFIVAHEKVVLSGAAIIAALAAAVSSTIALKEVARSRKDRKVDLQRVEKKEKHELTLCVAGIRQS